MGADRGAEASYEEVFRANYPRLVAVAAAITGSVEAGHDLAQETLLRAYDRWEDVRRYGHLAAWLRRVVTNLAIDRYRSAAAETGALGRLRAGGSAEMPELERWNELVAALDPRQRAVVSLYYGEDRSIEQIAEVLGLPEGSVKSTLWRARQRLRDVHLKEARDA